jgi:hypothetical protein
MPPPDSTIPGRPSPTVILVMPESRLLDACLHAVSELPDVPRMEVTDVQGTATAVARWRPFALIIPQDLYDFDPNEFKALAKDVGAEIIMVSADSEYGDIAAFLPPRLRSALEDWEARRVDPD